MSAPASPRWQSGLMTPGDIGTLTEEMQSLGTSDYAGAATWESLVRKGDNAEDEEDGYPFPLVLKKSRNGSVSSVASASGRTTPGATNGNAGGRSTLSEGDLARADEALSHHNSNKS
jgi:glycogen(starch) synthase